jgi:rubrerythrin
MKMFNARDVLHFAIRIEENGEIFYREAARAIGDHGAKDIFNRLATEEVGHKMTFQDMLETVGDYEPAESYRGEYLAYLQAYIDGKAVFKGLAGASSDLSQVADTASALDFAIQREVDSIIYYQETKEFVPEKHHKTVDRVIGEERRHFSLLSEMRKGYR